MKRLGLVSKNGGSCSLVYLAAFVFFVFLLLWRLARWCSGGLTTVRSTRFAMPAQAGTMPFKPRERLDEAESVLTVNLRWLKSILLRPAPAPTCAMQRKMKKGEGPHTMIGSTNLKCVFQCLVQKILFVF
jgi:hypothetical protein